MSIANLEKQLSKAEQADTIKRIRKELGEALAEGAQPCECGQLPVGMLKRPGYFDNRQGIDVPPIYEVGCIFCPPFYVEREDGEPKTLNGKPAKVKRRSFSARAVTPEDAVANWNAGKYVEDTRFGINVHPDEEKKLG